jgi:uracil-DNA glycosylase family 4
MDATGAAKPMFYFIGEAPGDIEDEQGEQFMGRAGEFVRSRVPSKWKNQIRWNNIINCHPPNHRNPSELEIACCRRRIVEDILESKPKAVVGFGNITLDWFIGMQQIRDVWRGRKLACRVGDHSFWFYPMLQPAYVVRMGGEGRRGSDWAAEFAHDLARVFEDADKGYKAPKTYTAEEIKEGIKIWKPSDDQDEWFKRIAEFGVGRNVGFDIETNDRLPYAVDAKILTASVSTVDKTLAFPIGHRGANLRMFQKGRFKLALRQCLMNAKRVVAQNSVFEQEWKMKESLFGQEVVYNIEWGDPLAQAYVLDERKGGKGLDDLSLIRLGINIKSLSTVNVKDLDNESLGDVLLYNGIDAKACLMVWFAQRKVLLREGLLELSETQERRQGTVARLMSRGMYPNMKAAEKFNQEYTEQMDELMEEICSFPEVKRYRNNKGKYDPTYWQDIKNVLHDMNIHVETTREDELSKIKHPFIKATLKYKEIHKLHSTYIKPIVKRRDVMPDGFIHGRFTFTKTATGRSASEEPNLQNFPKRENRQVRSIIGAPPGHIMVANDYGQIEFRVIGMASNDKRLVNYTWTDYDVHGHWRDKIIKAFPKWKPARNLDRGDKKKMKQLRDLAKNQWVFPLFFGAALESAGNYLAIDPSYLENIYNEFWEEFKGVKRWHEEILTFFKKHRYVETLTGRRRHWGDDKPMSPNQAINMPIQGTAGEIVADAMERLDALAMEREEPWLAPVLNVHDDLTNYIPNKYLGKRRTEEAMELIGKTMCLSPYPFINVPLIVEQSVGETWDALEEVRVYKSTEYGVKRDKS